MDHLFRIAYALFCAALYRIHQYSHLMDIRSIISWLPSLSLSLAFRFLLPLSRLIDHSPRYPTLSSSLSLYPYIPSTSGEWPATLSNSVADSSSSVFSRLNIAHANQIPNTYNVFSLGDNIPISTASTITENIWPMRNLGANPPCKGAWSVQHVGT